MGSKFNDQNENKLVYYLLQILLVLVLLGDLWGNPGYTVQIIRPGKCEFCVPQMR